MSGPRAISPSLPAQSFGSHCRICGSLKLNKHHFAWGLSDKTGLYRILQQNGSVNRLIRPCNCRGDFAFAHSVCLSDWIETTKHQCCDICRFRYKVNIFEQSIFDWISETNQIESILKVFGIVICIYYVSFLGIIAHKNSRDTGGLLNIMIITSAHTWIVLCTIYFLIKSHEYTKQFKAWKLANKRVVVEPNSDPQLDTGPSQKDVLKSSGFKPRDS